MEVSICVGSSCHLKGAHDVIKRFQELAETYTIEKIALSASFCRDKCRDGVVVSIDGVLYTGVSPEKVVAILDNHRSKGTEQ